MDYTAHPGRIKDIPYSIIEDDLPKIRPRYFSIVNDPIPNKGKVFKICFTVLKYPHTGSVEEMREGLCTSFLRDVLVKQMFDLRIKMQFSSSNKVISLDQESFI